MARQYSVPEQIPFVEVLPIATDAAGRTGSYISLKNALKAWLVCEVNQGNAAQVTFTPLQAQDVAGTGSKAIAATRIHVNQDRAASDIGAWQAAAAALQLSATLKSKIAIFEIVPEQVLDVTNGFRTLTVQTSASNAANITKAMLVYLPAYMQAAPPSTLIN
ncbi:MAG: hypothetical protein HXX10_07635 [Rhodoplanes sp.]|uniref:hypothetical protein n=1 Tax=Rhodoplanes sp. TaxID=1968906 RepID=UPI0017F1B89B|nr:hypothetical protein [Rhodoplanes sp.]NVO13892.1 hypothetical protein [Rhodoplanes sp.]